MFLFSLYLCLSSSCVLHLFCLCHLPLSFWQFRKQSVLLVLFFSFLCVYPCLGPMSCLRFCICLCYKINLNLSLGIYWRQSVLFALCLCLCICVCPFLCFCPRPRPILWLCLCLCCKSNLNLPFWHLLEAICLAGWKL